MAVGAREAAVAEAVEAAREAAAVEAAREAAAVEAAREATAREDAREEEATEAREAATLISGSGLVPATPLISGWPQNGNGCQIIFTRFIGQAPMPKKRQDPHRRAAGQAW